MRIGVNVPNFGPGTDPGVLRRWAGTVEDLGYGLLVVSDHLVVTPDVREQYPPPFYEPFTTLAWLAGITERVTLGTSIPRIVLRLTDAPLAGLDRRAGEGTLEQVLDDIDRLEKAGAGSVVLDPYDGDISTAATEEALRALHLVAQSRKV